MTGLAMMTMMTMMMLPRVSEQLLTVDHLSASTDHWCRIHSTRCSTLLPPTLCKPLCKPAPSSTGTAHRQQACSILVLCCKGGHHAATMHVTSHPTVSSDTDESNAEGTCACSSALSSQLAPTLKVCDHALFSDTEDSDAAT